MIKVMIVEDDPMVREFNKHYLQQMSGFQHITSVSNGDEALDVLQNEPIDLILLDIYMPGMNGLQLLETIRLRDQSVDVIVITAASDIVSVKKALRLGAVDYLIKPFEFSRFQAALHTYREEVNLMQSQNQMSQEELDKLLFHAADVKGHTESIDLPKGLTKNTLQLVYNCVDGMKGKSFTTEELAAEVGISRVSMRKYLQFLNEIGVLDVEICYGFVGRPSYTYRYLPDKASRIHRYL
ncbi:response regulator [Paenibacillus sp. SC116]|uniref:response regulator n=1 Tax=Paenibacillus sp. SC116 TaxID=2968986 RepID=UPI00215AAAFA|nr:response regulator [Paenibacillus sp. SC116]MCR8843294.1 response regulator [Paenibacillus sp. SC116]